MFDKQGKTIILTFSECTVFDNVHDKQLFDPSWGVFDLVIGQEIKSNCQMRLIGHHFDDLVNLVQKQLSQNTINEDLNHKLYGVVRQVRENKNTFRTKRCFG